MRCNRVAWTGLLCWQGAWGCAESARELEPSIDIPASEFAVEPVEAPSEDGMLDTTFESALGPDAVNGLLCSACTSNAECGGGSNYCLRRSDGARFCGRDCRTSGCPTGYSCLSLSSTVAQCVPARLECPRSGDDAGVRDGGVRADGGAGDGGLRTDGGQPARGDAGAVADVPATAACAGAAAWDPVWAGYEDEVLRRSNLHRQAGASCGTSVFGPVAPLRMNAALRCAARLHAKDMIVRGYFSHTTPEGGTFAQRITQAGYTFRAAGENIASGYRTPEAVVSGWMASPGHCRNLMSASFTEIGVGFYDGYSWVQSFAAPL